MFGHVRLRTAFEAGVEQSGGLTVHQVSGLEVGIGVGNRKLNALIFTDRIAKDYALVGIVYSAFGHVVTVADYLRCN